MKRRTSAPAGQPEPGQDDEDRAATRRALLTRGGVVAAGVVGAGVAGAAVAGRANATVGSAVIQGQLNDAGTDPPTTEIRATNNIAATPTVVLTNTGSPAAGEASPSLRLTPAATNLFSPASATVGGDLVATNDGELYFTHNATPTPIPAAVHTDATSNSFVPLAAPVRILDTRFSNLRASILDPTGNLDSSFRLLGGKTIHIDLSSLVFLADAMTANLSVIGPLAGGYVTLWSGAVGKPNASSISFGKGQAISNLTVSGLAHPSQTVTDSIAIFAVQTTHVILDVTGFTVRFFGQVLASTALLTTSRATQIQAARAAIAKRPS